VNSADGFLNIHPFFVHAPLVLLPLAAIMTWLGLLLRKDGFDTATRLITLAAALSALAAMGSGLSAKGSFPVNAALGALMAKHESNGIVLTVLSSIAALLAIGQWRGILGKRSFCVRTAILTFVAIGVFFSGFMGAQMVYLHGAAVVPVVEQAKRGASAGH
jgi:uncharacterized membrane protein